MWVDLPSEPHSDLQWSLPEADQKITWRFKLGLEQPGFPLEDELRFNALALALTRFTKEVFPKYAEQTEAICLYRGPIPTFPLYFQMLAHKLPDEVPIFLLFTIEPSTPLLDAVELI